MTFYAKVLIIGITGMVGSHLADLLLKLGNFKIYGMCRWRSSLDNIEHLITSSNKHNNPEFITGDITDYLSISKIIKKIQPKYIFHLAAQSFPRTSFDEPILTFNTNINGTYNVLESIRNYSKNSITHVCSSSEIFGKVKKKDLPIKESNSFHPASPYAISKVGTDLIAKFYFEAYNLKVITTRMFTHTGPRRGEVFAESSFAKQIALIEKGLKKPEISVGNLNSLRTYADVRDAVKAYYLAIIKYPIPGNVYNIGGNYSCKVKDMLKHLISLSDS